MIFYFNQKKKYKMTSKMDSGKLMFGLIIGSGELCDILGYKDEWQLSPDEIKDYDQDALDETKHLWLSEKVVPNIPNKGMVYLDDKGEVVVYGREIRKREKAGESRVPSSAFKNIIDHKLVKKLMVDDPDGKLEIFQLPHDQGEEYLAMEVRKGNVTEEFDREQWSYYYFIGYTVQTPENSVFLFRDPNYKSVSKKLGDTMADIGQEVDPDKIGYYFVRYSCLCCS